MGRPKITIPLGARFGKLEVIGPYGMLNEHYSVVCRCDCGDTKEVTCSNLRNKQTTSCGCNKVREKYQNLVGKMFGRLTVLDDSLRVTTHRLAKCLCSCGNETTQPLHAIVDGRVVSCGCLRNQQTLERSTKHGHAERQNISPEYRCWASMKARCQNPKAPSYADYGGRGIKICDRWLESFENFLADMGDRPRGMTLDRYPDVNGNYIKSNCRWATGIEQGNNRRNTPMVEYQGRTQSIANWARELGFQYWSLRNRIVNLGWSIEKAFTTPAVLGRNQYD